MNIDFKTPVLAKLKELAETDNHPRVRIYTASFGNKQNREFDIWVKAPRLEEEEFAIWTVYDDTIGGSQHQQYVLGAVILGIFDDIVSAAVDATVPPSLKTKVIELLTELNGKKGEGAHSTYAVLEGLSIGGKPITFRLIRWKSAWDMLVDPNPGNIVEVDCRKPADDEQWELVAAMLGMPVAADNQVEQGTV